MAASLLTALKCCAFQSACDAYNGSLNSSRISPVVYLPSSVTFLPQGNFFRCVNSRTTKTKTVFVRAMLGDEQPNDDENEDPDQSSTNKNSDDTKDDKFRKHLERSVGKDDSAFSGMELATLIRNKYGRSYDVQLIKKEFMGRNLLALNVMWKYREQRSFPLTEEEYLLRLDDVANNLKCWGAVSHIRSSLAKVKERPRIGKAVSIFIDLDETGGRANEWIYR